MQKFEVFGPLPEKETKHKTIRCIECFGGDVVSGLYSCLNLLRILTVFVPTLDFVK